MATREPVSPRLLNPLVPRDFETICLKCLEKNPARRYDSADALAEDLRRALADEPILARPPSPLGRFLRWCRRRPALAAAWLLLAVLAVVSAASAVVVARSNARATAQLRAALLAQAQAAQLTGRIGQRFDSLAALRTAAAIQPGLDLRDVALTALALPDARITARWRPRFAVTSPLTFDPSTENYVVESAEGLLTFRRRRDDVELRKFTPPPGRPRPVYVAPFAPDGGHFAVRFADGSAAVYETARSEPRFVITGRPVRQLVFFALDFCLTPDGTELVLPLPEGGVPFTTRARARKRDASPRQSCLRSSPCRRMDRASRSRACGRSRWKSTSGPAGLASHAWSIPRRCRTAPGDQTAASWRRAARTTTFTCGSRRAAGSESSCAGTGKFRSASPGAPTGDSWPPRRTTFRCGSGMSSRAPAR